MNEITLRFFRVRAYDPAGRIAYSFRVEAANASEAEEKVREHIPTFFRTIVARPAGRESFWQ